MSLRAEAHAEPAGLRGPRKDHSGGASYGARERKPTMPHSTLAQPPPQAAQIGTTTTPSHHPTYIGEVAVVAPLQDSAPLRSAFAQSAGFPRAHSTGDALADAMHAGSQGSGQLRAGGRGAWSIGESTGRSSFDSQELTAWRPSQDGAAHDADAGRPYVDEMALQVCA